MTTKEEFLGRIRTALADIKDSPAEEPLIPKVWELQGLSVEEMSKQFSGNLTALKGEIVLCDSFDDAVHKIRSTLKGIDAKKIGVMSNPLAKSVAGRIHDKELLYAPEQAGDTSPEALEMLDASLVSPDLLLADTGSCFFAAPDAFNRLLTYIVPVSLVIANTSMLREHLPAAWTEVKPLLKDANSGEFVIVTGPSRTADIEKVLILGVHGPKRVMVFLIDEQN
ncbi:MAG: lactate utilization protein [Planctomycetaceae bacterium]|nr:lactate utilization protein [Planctomycetaceae bacterium]